eukprot:2669732-Alexandrium_andersonii.AAC.1
MQAHAQAQSRVPAPSKEGPNVQSESELRATGRSALAPTKHYALQMTQGLHVAVRPEGPWP